MPAAPGTAWPFGDTAPVAASALLADPGQVPRRPGIYGWLFDPAALAIDTTGCLRLDGWPLLYLGVAQGRAASTGHLRGRLLGNHLGGNAGASTLRRSLGSILRTEMNLSLHLGRSRGSDSWGAGETVLTEWLARHARVAWRDGESPWVSERQLIGGALRLPLNIQRNPRENLRVWLCGLRREAIRAGVPRRPAGEP